MISRGLLLNLEFVFRTDYGVLFRVKIKYNMRSQTVSLTIWCLFLDASLDIVGKHVCAFRRHLETLKEEQELARILIRSSSSISPRARRKD
jgi:hypothetical protein